MSRLGAEMRHVDHRRRIIRPQLDHLAYIKRFESLAQLQHGQGA